MKLSELKCGSTPIVMTLRERWQILSILLALVLGVPVAWILGRIAPRYCAPGDELYSLKRCLFGVAFLSPLGAASAVAVLYLSSLELVVSKTHFRARRWFRTLASVEASEVAVRSAAGAKHTAEEEIQFLASGRRFRVGPQFRNFDTLAALVREAEDPPTQ